MTAKITFVGAGSVVFTQGLLADLFAYPELDGVHVALHDIDPDRLATALAAARRIAAVRGVKPVLTAHADRREALGGGGFGLEIAQIGVGGGARPGLRRPARPRLRPTTGAPPRHRRGFSPPRAWSPP